MDRPDDPFENIERFVDQLTEFGPIPGGDVAVDVIDEGDEIVVVADLPGYQSEDIDVELHEDQRLRIAAERSEEHVSEDGIVVRSERRSEQVSRTVRLPEPVLAAETDATYENGVLTVHLAKETESDVGTDIPVS